MVETTNPIKRTILKSEYDAISFQVDTKTEGKEQRWLTRILCNTSLSQAFQMKNYQQTTTCMFAKTATGPNKEGKRI